MPAVSSFASPPILPLPRQPSPLSFSSISGDEHSSASTPVLMLPPDLTSPHLVAPLPIRGTAGPPSPPKALPLRPTSQRTVSIDTEAPATSRASVSSTQGHPVPVLPAPDSLVLRTTLNHLEAQTVTLKRLAKNVLSQLHHLTAIYDQLDRAEDDLLCGIGELARWLGAGYGLKSKLWDDEVGLRGIKRERRKREREDLEVMVEHGLEGLRVELKRRGLAGGGAHAKFDRVQAQYYNSTATYLSPQPSSSSQSVPNPQATSHSTSSASTTATSATAAADSAQAVRTAQFELQAYQHQSALLFAVPPSSTLCLDLLVGLHSWGGTMLGEGSPGAVTDHADSPRARKVSGTGSIGSPQRLPAGLETPVRILSRQDPSYSPSTSALKTSLADSLAQLAQTRAEILHGWSLRDNQLNLLENELARRQAEADGTRADERGRVSPIPGSGWTGPVSSNGLEHKKAGKKMHKIHRSVGGRLRDLLSSSGSSMSLAGMERGTNPAIAERSSRISLDGHGYRPGGGHGKGHISGHGRAMGRPSTETVPEGIVLPVSLMTSPTVPFPDATPRTPSGRAVLAQRHSIQIDPSTSSMYSTGATSPDLASSITSMPISSPTMMFGGLGGLMGTGDEDERREMVGRKKEGVLWGLGSWEGLSKAGGGRSKWEMMWVVLDHSSIYEYRGMQAGQPGSPHAVIDLKFASVREGRGTDRRFVFEIVSAKEGRRLYQATSEAEMKTWLYAIANAIESCINGTSSVRTFDTSKLRTSSGALDDHALPRNHRRLSATPKSGSGSGLGTGFPISLMANRRSMPPPMVVHRNSSEEGRVRKTSLKKVWKQGTEMAGEKWSSVMGGAGGGGGGREDSKNPGRSTTARLGQASRSSDHPSRDGRTTPPSSRSIGDSSASPSSSRTRPSDRTSWFEESADGEIEKRVFEMAGLGLGLAVGAGVGRPSSEGTDRHETQTRRIQSEGVRGTLQVQPTSEQEGKGITRARSADTPPIHAVPEVREDSDRPSGEAKVDIWDMKRLREIADRPENAKCADCGKGMRSSRWATISLHDRPLVLFLCIRCCGLHRSLGTHISKPRSVDLDHWTPGLIMTAAEWGNERGNAVWLASKGGGGGGGVADEDMGAFIRAKYVEGRWLSPEEKADRDVVVPTRQYLARGS